jgi:hypothetical protein
MREFIAFFDMIKDVYPMHMELTYSKTLDWRIHIWRKGTGDGGEDEEVLAVQDCDVGYVIAKAHSKLKEWVWDGEKVCG